MFRDYYSEKISNLTKYGDMHDVAERNVHKDAETPNKTLTTKMKHKIWSFKSLEVTNINYFRLDPHDEV